MSEEVDDLFNSTVVNSQTRGRLANVFTQDFKDENTSLSYVPKKKESPETAILYANPSCQLYILESGKFVPQGKIGVAIIGKIQSEHYHILCYKSNTEFLCTATIFEGFSFKTQNHYSYFYDDNSRAFSLSFKSPEDAITFSQYITIARYKLSDLRNTVWMDLNDATGKTPVQISSKVQITYSGWLLVKSETGLTKLGNMFDSNVSSGKPLIFTVGEHSVIKGLEEGIIGLKAGGKRFLVIPSHLAYGDSDRNQLIPPNSTLCFQIELIKVKAKSKTQEGTNTPPPMLKDSPREEVSQLTMQQKLIKVGQPTIFNLVDPQPQPQMMIQTPQQQIVQQPQQQIVQQPQQYVQQQPQQQIIQQPQQQYVQQPQQQYQVIQQPQQPQVVHQQTQQLSQQQYVQQNSSNETIEVLKKQVQQLTDMIQKKENVQIIEEKKEIKKEEKKEELLDNDSKMNALLNKVDQLSSKLEQMDLTSLIKTKDREQKERLLSAPILLQSIQHIIELNEKFRKEIAEERITIDNLNDKISLLRKKASEKLETNDDFLQKELDNANQKAMKLNARVLQLQETLDKEREDFYVLKQKNEQTDTQFTETKIELEKYKKLYEKLTGESSEKEIDLRDKLLNLQKDHEKLKLSIQTITVERDTFSSELNSKKEEIDSLKKQFQKEKENHIKEIEFEKNKHLEYIKDTGNSKSELINELDKERSQKHELEKRCDSLKDESSKYLDEIKILQNSKVILEKELSDSKEEKEKLKEFITKAKSAIEGRDNQIEEMETSHEKKLEELKQMFKEKVSEIKNNYSDDLKETFSQAVKDLTSGLFFAVQPKFDKEKRYYASKFFGALTKELKKGTMVFLKALEEDTLEDFEIEKDEEEEVLSDDDTQEEVVKTIEKIVEKIVEVPVVKEVIKEVIVEKIVEVPVVKEVIVEKFVETQMKQQVKEVEKEVSLKSEENIRDEKEVEKVEEKEIEKVDEEKVDEEKVDEEKEVEEKVEKDEEKEVEKQVEKIEEKEIENVEKQVENVEKQPLEEVVEEKLVENLEKSIEENSQVENKELHQETESNQTENHIQHQKETIEEQEIEKKEQTIFTEPPKLEEETSNNDLPKNNFENSPKQKKNIYEDLFNDQPPLLDEHVNEFMKKTSTPSKNLFDPLFDDIEENKPPKKDQKKPNLDDLFGDF